jgi:acyl-coenzyme A thioesterase 13
MSASAAIPRGFAPPRRIDRLLELLGPVLECDRGTDYRLGLRLDDRHAATGGQCHGGVAALLAEALLQRLCARAAHPPLVLAPASLSFSFLGSARIGDWLEASGRIDHARRALTHSTGLVAANGKPILRASGVFQVTARARG